MQIKKSIIKTVILSKIFLIPAALAVELQTDILDTPEKIVGILGTVAGWLFTILFALAVVMIMYAAFLYLTAAGNPDRINSAKNTLVYAIVAMVVALVAGGIPTLIEGILTDAGSNSASCVGDCITDGGDIAVCVARCP